MCDRERFHYGTGVRLSPCNEAPIIRLVKRSLLSNENLKDGDLFDTDNLSDFGNHTNLINMVLEAAGFSGSGSDLEAGINDLYPAVLECFAVIFLGYFAGKAGIITSSESKGLNTFIGTFSLPALIFLSMAQLNLNAVNWTFLLAICLAKACIFLSVIVISLLVSKPKKLDRAGLFAIFCTQSNDFALGYPIVKALYGKSHPQYPDYLYLVAPVNLILLNPIAFTMMEIARQKSLESQEMQSRGSTNNVKNALGMGAMHMNSSGGIGIFKRVLRGVLLNPIVLMTGLGILGNLVFHGCLPSIVEGILKVLGSAFSASALFSLGLTMVGSAASLKGAGFVVPGILIAIKLLVMPLVAREFVSLLQAGVDVNETVSLSNYAFLYGTFPTAPGVFVYATQFEMAVQMIAGAMVACTFISAPLMFVSAKMITLTKLNPRDYVKDLDSFLFNMSILGLIASFWVVVVFVLSRKWKKVPHCITLCLVISQSIACVGAILWSSIGVNGNQDWRLFLEFGVFAFGVFSSRIWTAILAASLVFLRCRSLCFVLKLRPYMGLIGWGIPAALVTVLMLTVQRESFDEKQDPNFQYGETQALVAVMVLIISFIVTIGCLVMQQRYERHYAQYATLFNQSSAAGSQLDIESQSDCEPLPILPDTSSSSSTAVATATITPCTSSSSSIPRPTSLFQPQPQSNHHHSRKHFPGIAPPARSIGFTRTKVVSSGGCNQISSGCCQDRPVICKPKPKSIVQNHDQPMICVTEIEDLGAIAASHGLLPRQRRGSIRRDDHDLEEEDDDDELLFSYDDDLCSSSKHPCNLGQRKHCSLLLERYKSLNHLTEPAEIGIVRDRDDEFQMMRHIVLLLLLCSSMFVGIGLCLWTLITEEVSGIYVELVFLDAALNFGQGFFTFMLFGLNTRMVIMPVHKWWRRLAYGEGAVHLPKWEDLSMHTKQICEQFLTYHIDKCIQDIVRDRRWRMESFNQVFCGHELVDWLLLVGLARDRNEAVKYGKHLLTGRVIRHIKNLHHFHDQAFFYTFSQTDM